MGQHELAATEDCTSKVLELDLFNKKKGADRQKLPGKLYVEVTTTRRMEDHQSVALLYLPTPYWVEDMLVCARMFCDCVGPV